MRPFHGFLHLKPYVCEVFLAHPDAGYLSTILEHLAQYLLCNILRKAPDKDRPAARWSLPRRWSWGIYPQGKQSPI